MIATDSSPISPLPRGVRRALDAMRADVGRDWKVGELAAVAGVSARSLQRQFLLFLGKTPVAILRDIGFERARRELLQGVQGSRVADIARRCGFAHCGRFSIEYRQRYGETPSQTLKRQSRFAAAFAAMRPAILPARQRPAISFGKFESAGEHLALAADLSADVTGALSRSGVAVVAETGSARYQLFGALRGQSDQLRLVVRLIDHETGRQLWAHRSDGLPAEAGAFEEHLGTRIAAALLPCLRLAEIEGALHKPSAELSAHDLALQALPGVVSLDADGNARSLELLARALERDPRDGLATALAAWAHVQRVVYHFGASPTEDRATSLELAGRARALPGDATMLAVLGNALTLLDELDAAELVIRKALSIDGGSAWAWSRSGWIDVYRGDPRSAIERFRIALDLAPHDQLAFNSMVGIGCANFKAGDYAEAARWQERALLEHPSAIWVHRTLCPAYVLAGDETSARRSLAALRGQNPDLTVSGVEQGLPPLPPSYSHLVVEALHEIGLPA